MEEHRVPPVRTLLKRLSDILPSQGIAGGTGTAGGDERQIGKAVGLSQFGVNHLVLRPGAMSSNRHWHEEEDEFVMVLSGTVILVDDNGDHELTEGAFIGFPAGVANAHHLINRSQTQVELLVVGTRKVGEERVHYPDQEDLGPVVIVRNARGARIGGSSEGSKRALT